ncbi:MAG: IPT/TIG domain-containing protein [Candidatus Acidiferrales bacterium]
MFRPGSGPQFLPRLFSLGVQRLAAVMLFCSLAALSGCHQGGNNGGGSTSTPAPAISNLNPSSGAVGTLVVITGSNFGASQGSSTVTFGAISAAMSNAWSAGNISVTVPAGATTGNVVVTVGGQASNGMTFTVLVPTPSITSLSPTSGAVGSSVTISGANFGSTQGASTVTFGATPAGTATAWSAASITVTVPTGATTGNVVVTVGGKLSNGAMFTLTANGANVVTGTASLGAPIASATVTLKDANGNISAGTTAADGTFTLDSGGFTPPFLVQVVTVTASGPFPAGTTLYSVSADANATTNINVHVLSDLIVRSYYSASGVNPNSAFANPAAPGNAPPSPLAVQNIANAVIQVMQLWFDNAGITVTADASAIVSTRSISQSLQSNRSLLASSKPDALPPSCGSINLISGAFTANDTCLDSVLQSITSETLNSSNGSVTAMTVTGGSITETVNPTYSTGSITVNTTTTNSSTGTSSTESVTALALSSAAQTLTNAIDAQLTALAKTVNTDGNSLTGGDLLQFFAGDYLNDGDNATEDADIFAGEVAGLTITSAQIVDIVSLNTTTNVAEVVVNYVATESGQTATSAQTYVFKEENSTWLVYGDQRIAQVSVTAESRTSQGAPSLGAGVSNGIYLQAAVQAPASVGVTAATVAGGGNSVWPCTVSSTCPNGDGPTGTLAQEAALLQNGQSFSEFQVLSEALGSNVPPAGTPFTLNLITTSSGSPQFTVPSNATTTEVISFAHIPTASGSGPLSSVVGKTITYNWTLPTTYAIGQVSLFTYIFDGSPTSSTAHSCSIGGNGLLGITSTSGSITIPANMSACGLSASDAIASVQIFLEVDGVNGEQNLVDLGYPY